MFRVLSAAGTISPRSDQETRLSFIWAISDVISRMSPVGGFFTIDCKKAHDMTNLIDPKVVIPMHYSSKRFGYEQISGREEFVELIGNDEDREIISRRFVAEELPKVRALLLMEPLKILR